MSDAVGKALAVPLAGVAVAVAVACASSYASPLRAKLYAGAWHEMPVRAVSWMRSPPRDRQVRIVGGMVLAVSALAGVGASGMLAFAFLRASSVRKQLRPGEAGAAPEPVRAGSKLHGAADWLPEADMRRLVVAPHVDHGGVVFGAAVRGDLHPADNGGMAPLLLDRCTDDAPHGQVYFGSGGGKTTAVTIPNLDPDVGWRGNVLVNDPSSQAGAMCAAMREEAGQRVVFIGPPRRPDEAAGPSRVGVHVFAGLDPAAETFEQDVRDAADSLGREFDGAAMSGENAMFKLQGRALQRCLLADMLSDPATPAEERTPLGLVRRVMAPEPELRGRLEDIFAGSPSTMARMIAGPLTKAHPKTFGSFLVEAGADLEWLQVRAYAELVSGTGIGSMRPDDFARGDVCAFLQLGIRTMEGTPQIGRAILNALLGAIYRTNGATGRRYLLLNDEAKLFGKLGALSTAMSQGRKYGVSVVSMWHGPAQMEELLGKGDARTWRTSSGWEAFSAMDAEAAKHVSDRLGTYTALAPSEGQSDSTPTGFLGNASGSKGRNEGVTLAARKLATPEELEFGLRKDEQVVFRRGASGPIRCLKPYYYRRPAMAAKVGRDTYRAAAE